MIIMKRYRAILLLLCGLQVNAQQNSFVRFTPPFDFPLTLSGNFGEIRTNHFHGGLDFKTQGMSGKRVLALADGYISRIRVTHGSGYTLDVCYDNGYSTVNRHLSGFVAPIAGRVEELQYARESWEVTIVPEKDEYRVKAGQHIAWSGNTGYSFGPHLHLEMLEDATGDYVDPLPFFRKYLRDTRAPRAVGHILFPQAGRGVVNGKTVPQAFRPGGNDTVRAWGVIGAGIRAYDYMDGTNNRQGVHTVILAVDGEEVFRSVVDRFSADESRMINSWTHDRYMKSFIEPGNTLRMLTAGNADRGLVTIGEERNYHFRYTLQDAYGNTSRYDFVVKGVPQSVPSPDHRNRRMFRRNRVNTLQEPGLELIVLREMMYDDVALNFAVRADSGAVAFTYQLHDEPTPLHRYGDLRIGVRRKTVADTTKYYMARVDDKGRLSYVGGAYENGYVRSRIYELGTYTVAVDTVSPAVIALNPYGWARSGKIVYKIKDGQTGIRSYRGTVDGEYALFGWNIMNDRIVYDIDPKRVKRGARHVVEITVTDHCGNKTVVRNQFKY
jgi:murein DD-endopeptidase MepM/ murein hydrolase activator NlpD